MYRAGTYNLDTSDDLARCPCCGSVAGYRKNYADAGKTLRAECANGGCQVSTQYHYASREQARDVWNRREAQVTAG